MYVSSNHPRAATRPPADPSLPSSKRQVILEIRSLPDNPIRPATFRFGAWLALNPSSLSRCDRRCHSGCSPLQTFTLTFPRRERTWGINSANAPAHDAASARGAPLASAPYRLRSSTERDMSAPCPSARAKALVPTPRPALSALHLDSCDPLLHLLAPRFLALAQSLHPLGPLLLRHLLLHSTPNQPTNARP